MTHFNEIHENIYIQQDFVCLSVCLLVCPAMEDKTDWLDGLKFGTMG